MPGCGRNSLRDRPAVTRGKGVLIAMLCLFAAQATVAAPMQPARTLQAEPLLTGDRLQAFLDAARRAQRDDLQAWHRYAFNRRVIREKLDSDGEVTSREVLEFRLRPIPSAFDEELMAVDGKPPDAGLVAEHRRAARFSERYRQALGACDENAATECPDEPAARDAASYGVQVPLAGRDFIHEGRETVAGVACHRLQLLELEAGRDAGARERVGAATIGTLWLSVDGAHMVRAELRLARPLSLFGGLSRLAALDIVVETGVLADGLRLPARIAVGSDLRVVGFAVRKRNLFVYSDFKKVAAGSP